MNIPNSTITYNPYKKYGVYKIRDNALPTLKKEVNSDMIKIFLEDITYINLYRTLKERLIQAEMNLIEFKKSSLSGFSSNMDNDLLEKLYKDDNANLINANRLCNNYAFSLFNNIELMEKQIIKDYQENSENFLKWKEIESGYFSNCFEYRFVKILRNFAHISNPVAGIYYSNSKAIALFDKSHLKGLKQFKKADFIGDWLRLGDTFHALPILEKSLEPLKEVSKEHLKLNKELLINHAQSLIESFGEPSNHILAVGERKKVGENTLQLIPLRLARKIIDHFG